MSEAPALLPFTADRDPVRVCLDCLSEGFQIIGFDWSYVYVRCRCGCWRGNCDWPSAISFCRCSQRSGRGDGSWVKLHQR